MPKVLITAGPTHEAIDPVRFLANRSSGKMGYALAQAALEAKAEVVLVSGPVNLPLSEAFLEGLTQLVAIESAAQMAAAVQERIQWADIIICAAAVADWTPAQVASEKVKKTQLGQNWVLEFVPTIDILGSLRDWGFTGTLVGFAAETQNLMENAQGKLNRKGCDFLVANDVSQEGIGFGSEENEVTLLRAQARTQSPSAEALPRLSKLQLAHEIWKRVSC